MHLPLGIARMVVNEIAVLVKKEMQLEWRQKYAIHGLLLYLASTIFVCYLSFKAKNQAINPITWNTLFWIILLFTAVNAVGKSFTQEPTQRNIFYFTLVSPEAVIYSKIIYNSLILLFISMIGFVFYSWVMGNPVGNMSLYLITLLLGSIGFASTLSLVAGIAAQGENTATLMAVLSFPIIIPLLLLLLKMSKSALDGISISENWDEIAILASLDVIVIVLSGILFPYIWRH
ncbi:heme exporter protein CcmB [Aquirufa sp. ROCK2-A2]